MLRIAMWPNNTNDNVYNAVVVAQSRPLHLYLVHVVNADWTPGGRQPLD